MKRHEKWNSFGKFWLWPPRLGQEDVLHGWPPPRPPPSIPVSWGQPGPTCHLALEAIKAMCFPHLIVQLVFRAFALSVFISCNIHHTGLFMGPLLGSYFSGLVNKTFDFAACQGDCGSSDVSLTNRLFFFPTTALLEKFICILLAFVVFFSFWLVDVGQSRSLSLSSD